MADTLDGKIIVICGDDGPLTDANAARLGDLGATVVVSADPIDSLADAEKAFADIVATHGGIDVLVNSGSLRADYPEVDLESIDLGEWRAAAADEATRVLLAIQAVVPHLRNRGGGRIICFSSDAAEVCANADGVGQLLIQGITVGFARELGKDRITVNAIAAGPVALDEPSVASAVVKQALSEPGTVDDLTRMTAFLLSDGGAWITGQILHVNGGYWMRPA